MLRTILAGLKARTARLVLSSIAIALGVAFVSGTLVLGDAMKQSMQDEFAKGARGVDVSVALSGEDAPAADAPQGISAETLDKVRHAQGVAGADTRSYQQVPLITAAGKAKPATAGPLASTEQLREYDLADGRYPSSATEAAVDVRSLSTSKLAIGQQLTLLGKDDQKHSFTIVGTFRQGANSMSLGGSDHIVLLPAALRTLDPDVRDYQLVATAAPGVSQQQLLENIRTAIGAKGYVFQTGDQLTQQTLTEINSRAGEFTQVLLAFAVIALVVAAMVIYNTFTILVAQRTRELALMRCVGASRGQVFRSVLAEAVAMGLFASVIGLFGGLGVSALLQKVIGSFGEDTVTTIYTPLGLNTVLAAFGVGVLITVLSAVLPARKATRVAPVAALRSQLDTSDEVKRTGKLRVVFAVLLGVLGVAAIAFGFTLKEEAAMLVSGVGTMILLAMVLVLGPLLVGPVNRVLGGLPKLMFGVPAKLASANAGRNPKRTAATTAALMIGVTIVSLVTVVATSAKTTANAEVDQRFPADYTVSSSLYSRQLPKDLADQLSKVPEVAKVAPTSGVGAELGNNQYGYFTGVSPAALGDLVRPKVVSGSLDRLGDGDLAISQKFAERTGIALGESVTLTSGGRGATTEEKFTHQVKVVAIIETGQLGNGLVSMGTVGKLDPKAEGYENILVKLKDGVSTEAGRKAVEKVTDASPLAVIDSAAETKAQLSAQLDQVLAFVWALIGLAVIIALFGIANTLTLSVLERTRESALLRALGLTKGQLRLMLVVESILMAVMGAAIGLVLGVGFGWVITTALSSNTLAIAFTVPFGQIGVMLLAAVVAAIIAAALPARRAGRTSIVSGMAEA
jgi:putative ABC transport system permease protein